ncbi:MAG TPA: glycosyltransferase [Acidimicrobiia bacterium]
MSIVFETANSIEGGTDRAQDVLRAIAAQAATLGRPVELILVFDDLETDRTTLERIVAEIVPTPVSVTLIPQAGSRYYEQKNVGALRAQGDIVLFLDSDTMPEPECLTELVRPFNDPAVEVVTGVAYTEYVTTTDKAFALAWNFHLRSTDGPPFPTRHLKASVVAFRRETFERHPFPNDARFRGQCNTLAQQLRTRGVEILVNPRARSGHPRPTGLGYMTRRALCEGHDRLLTTRQAGTTRHPFIHSLRKLAYDLKRSAARVMRDHREVDLPAWQVPIALGVAAYYDGCCWLGWVITLVRPALIRSHLRV